jgi:hypothetical protein
MKAVLPLKRFKNTMTQNQILNFVEKVSSQDASTGSWADLAPTSEQLNFQTLTSRAILAHHIDWTAATSSTILPLFNGVTTFSSSTLVAYLDLMAYNRMDLVITAKLNGTSFHSGLFLVSWVPAMPHALSAAMGRGLDVGTLSAYPHVKLQAASSDSVSLSVPYSIGRTG